MIDEQTSMVDVLHNSCRFFSHEWCGQCTPCREGTQLGARRCWTASRPASGRLKDLDLLLEIGDTIGIMPGTTICGLADGAAWPIKNAIRKFRGEFEEYIKRTNPNGCMETEAVPALELQAHSLADYDRLPTDQVLNPGSMNTHANCHRQRNRSRDRRQRAPERHSGRRAGGRRDSALLLAPGLSVVASCRMCLVEAGTKRRRDRQDRDAAASWCPACQTPATDGTVFVTNSEKVKQRPGDGRGGPAARPSGRLPDLRQGGRVHCCRTITSSTARTSGGPTSSRSPAAGATWATRSRCSSIAA